MRVLVPLVLLAVPLAAQEAPRRTVDVTGFVLLNGFYNTARTNNSDVPQFADSDAVGVSGGGGTVRQTRLGLLLNEADVLGASFTGEVDVDFFGGQVPSTGGRTFPLLRIRRVTGTLQWAHSQLLVGQEAPLIAERNPRSLAAVGFPEFAGGGNLWLWIPQVRYTVERGQTLRVALQAALLAPTTPAAQGFLTTQPDSAERTGRPYVQGRLRLAWGPPDDASEVGIGGHVGWLRGLDSASGDSMQTSQAVAFDARVKVGVVELVGEAFLGKGVAGLGGGAVGQNVGVQGRLIDTRGGWAQVNVRARPSWLVGGGCGMDDPEDADVPATGRLKNFVCAGHLRWEPAGPLVLGLGVRRFETTYASGAYAASHVNLAAGWRF